MMPTPLPPTSAPDLFPKAGSAMPREFHSLIKATLRGLQQMLQAEEGSVCWLDAPRQELVVTVTAGLRAGAYLGSRQPLNQGSAGRVATSRQPLLVLDVKTDRGLPGRPTYRTRSFLCVPLQTPTELFGVINLTDKITGEPFTITDLECAVQVANQLATALHALRHSDSLQRQVELTEKFAAIGRLAAGLVHELSNPLDGVNRYAGLLLEMVPEGHLRDYLLQIKAGLARMTSTVRTLGQFARLPNDPHPILDVNQILEETIVALGLPFSSPQVNVVREWAPTLPLIPDYGFAQIASNLLKNACDAMPNGGTLTVGTEPTDQGLLIRVRDTGVGIPPELQAAIFEPFFTTKAPGQGTGLGLAIAQEVVTRYQGTISVESEVGRGTTFLVHIPLAE